MRHALFIPELDSTTITPVRSLFTEEIDGTTYASLEDLYWATVDEGECARAEIEAENGWLRAAENNDQYAYEDEQDRLRAAAFGGV